MARLAIVSVVAFFAYAVCTIRQDLAFSWSKINFTWPADGENINNLTEADPNAYDTYIYENNVPMGANKWKDKVFVTIPRRRAGIPSTLNYVWLNTTNRHNVPLIPYPDWETNRQNTLNDSKIHLVSTYRMVVDECDRLWVIDDGRIESFGPSGTLLRVQKPSIVIIDLHTDKIIRRYFFKDSDLRPLTSTVNLVVDVDNSSCDDAYAYIPDLLGYGLIVYSFSEDDSWRMRHKYFYLESLSEDLHIAGMKFQWYDGLFSIGLSEKKKDGFRTAYFHVLAGTHIYSLSTKLLRNKELATRSYHGNDLQVLFDKGPYMHSSASYLHEQTNILFFGLISQNALGCWNTNRGKHARYVDVIFRDDEKFIYPSDVKIYQDEVIAVTNRFPVYVYKGLNYSDTNFRIWITKIEHAVKNTICYRR